MNDTPQTPDSKKQTILSVSGIALLVILVGAFIIWRLNDRVHQLADQINRVEAQSKIDTAAPLSDAERNEKITVTSGKQAFTMTVPIEWGPLIKATDSDYFAAPGMTQPTLGTGIKAKITETAGYGSDSAMLFSARLSDVGTTEIPQGTSADITLGKGDDALTGKKYAYVYPADEIVGIGHTRHQNDRVYHYVFTTKMGKKLDVIYSVYGSDPRNLVDTVDAIVQSIVVK